MQEMLFSFLLYKISIDFTWQKKTFVCSSFKSIFWTSLKGRLKKRTPPHTHAIGPIVEKKDPAEIST